MDIVHNIKDVPYISVQSRSESRGAQVAQAHPNYSIYVKIIYEFITKKASILLIQVIHSGISCITINNLHDANLCDQRLIRIIA